MSDPKQWVWLYHKQTPPEIPAHFPKRDQVFVLKDVFHERAGSLQRYITWAGVHYLVVVEPNLHCQNCLENALLEKIFKAFEDGNKDGWRERVGSVLDYCMTDVWSYLEKDYTERQAKGTLMLPVGLLDYDRTEVHKLQLKTIDGTVHALSSETKTDKGFQPIENRFANLRCFCVSDVQVLERITMFVFRVKIHGQVYCVKAGQQWICRAVEKLQKTLGVANIIHLEGLVVNKDGKILGMVTPFISGETLHRLSSASASQKVMWKEQISDAVKSLHKRDVVWGDAKPDNVLISSVNSQAVLIDFDGGRTANWVGEGLSDTKEGDLQALELILRHIDEKHTSYA